MPDNDPVALAIVTRTQMTMLGKSLKVVFRVEDGEEQFARLVQALDDPGLARRLLESGDAID